jgi:aminotransferase
VFTRAELSLIAELCVRHNVWAITDEIYEHILYTDEPHCSIATLPGMSERTITISGLSKTFSITGWRLGYAIAPRDATIGIRRVHDFLTVGAPHPLQIAAAAALKLPGEYYTKLRSDYARRRELLSRHLREVGFEFSDVQGAYYIMTEIAPFGGVDDVQFTNMLVKEIGVAVVPGSSFYEPKNLGRTMIRFMFAKKDETLNEAGRRLTALKALRNLST